MRFPGVVEHRDRSNLFVGAKRFYIRLADEEAEPDVVIDWTITDVNGLFSLCFDDADLQTNPDDFVVRAFSSLTPPWAPTLQVVQPRAPQAPLSEWLYQDASVIVLQPAVEGRATDAGGAGGLRQGRRGGYVGKSGELAVGEGGSFFCIVLSHIASVVKRRGLTARSVLAMV